MDIVLVLILLVFGALVYTVGFTRPRKNALPYNQKALSPALKELHSKCEKEEDRGLRISEIYFYPVRGLPGTRTKQARILDGRIMFDREWVLVDPKLPSNQYKPYFFLVHSEEPDSIRPHLEHDELTGRTTLRF